MKILILCTTDSMITNFLVPHIISMKDKGYTVELACSITGHFFSDLRNKYRFVVHEIKFQRSPFSIANISAFLNLNKLVKEKKYDVIFCHEPVGGAMGRIVGHINHCKVIYMAHGFHFYKGAPAKMILFYFVEKLLSNWTDTLVTINREDYQASLRFNATKKVLINGIGVDTSKFTYSPDRNYIRQALNISDKDIILLSVGELIKRKNHEVVIRALKEIKNHKIHYVIAGDGVLSEHLKNMTLQLNLEAQVHFLGYRTDINKLCNSADIFVMPSLQEGLSVALMEAMSCGKPIIASKIRGNIDLIDDGKGGYLVPAKGIKKYAQAIEAIVNDPKLMIKFGSYNINKVKLYDIQNVLPQVDALI